MAATLTQILPVEVIQKTEEKTDVWKELSEVAVKVAELLPQEDGVLVTESVEQNQGELGFDVLASDSDIEPLTIYAAWAIIVASYSGVEEVDLVSSTSTSLVGQQMRIRVQWNKLVRDLHQQIREQLERFPEHIDVDSNSFTIASPKFLAEIRASADKIRIIVKSHVADASVDQAHIRHACGQFERLLQSLRNPDALDTPLIDFKAITLSDLRQIWSWNNTVPETIDDVCIHTMFMERAQRHPNRPAICAHD